MIIHLNGMIGIGKLTVAKKLSADLKARLIDNHLLIDLVTTICERGSSDYFTFLRKFTDVILEEIAKKPEEIFIFTNALTAELDEDKERLDYLSRFSKSKNILFVQVLLNCGLEENKRRIIFDDRKTRGKLMNPFELEEICRNYSMYHPPTDYALAIDTTNLSAEEVSGQIKNYIEKIWI